MRAKLNIGVRSLPRLIDSRQAAGRYALTRDQARVALRVSEGALKKSVQRMVVQHRLAVPRRGFLVIVPIEYRNAGAPPASWFVDELMKFHGQPYYVGLLSAAALHGAAHQQPQEFQVVTDRQLRPATAGRSRIRFFLKRNIERTPVTEVKTETGFMRISSPEATALDLLRYPAAAGHLGNIATVLGELAEKLDSRHLVEAARNERNVSQVQRLGHILDRVGAGTVAEAMAQFIEQRRPRFVSLRSDLPAGRAARDARWRVIVNESVEAET